ncbi:MAG: hypothetical protein NC251_12265 [Lachnoclostridium sp.]|nr:hypothetical protein [Lachnoclostridium sp.]MCM1536424.1 hypothetical protein [Clostridium sp.]
MIFGISIEEIDRQLSMNPVSCDKNSPINANEFLEPCIRGGEKILKDEKKRNMMKKIYRR